MPQLPWAEGPIVWVSIGIQSWTLKLMMLKVIVLLENLSEMGPSPQTGASQIQKLAERIGGPTDAQGGSYLICTVLVHLLTNGIIVLRKFLNNTLDCHNVYEKVDYRNIPRMGSYKTVMTEWMQENGKMDLWACIATWQRYCVQNSKWHWKTDSQLLSKSKETLKKDHEIMRLNLTR